MENNINQITTTNTPTVPYPFHEIFITKSPSGCPMSSIALRIPDLVICSLIFKKIKSKARTNSHTLKIEKLFINNSSVFRVPDATILLVDETPRSKWASPLKMIFRWSCESFSCNSSTQSAKT